MRGYRTLPSRRMRASALAALLIPAIRRPCWNSTGWEHSSAQVKHGLRRARQLHVGLQAQLGDAELTLDIEPNGGAADSGDLEADLPELFAASAAPHAARKVALAY